MVIVVMAVVVIVWGRGGGSGRCGMDNELAMSVAAPVGGLRQQNRKMSK